MGHIINEAGMHVDLAKTRFGWKLIDTEEFPEATTITWFRLMLPQINRKDSGNHQNLDLSSTAE